MSVSEESETGRAHEERKGIQPAEVQLYPTNYLIDSAGERAVEAGVINLRFIEAWLEAK